MKWIGLTGGIGTGKSTVSRLLTEKFDIPVIDADDLARQALSRGSEPYHQVVQFFGKEVLDVKMEINRKTIGEIVFLDRSKLQILENLIHPYVQREVIKLKKHYQSLGKKSCIYDVPLLYEKQMQSQFDLTILVYANRGQQVKRISRRNPDWTLIEIESRLSAQIDIEDKKNKSDYVLDNTGSLEDLEQQIQLMVTKLNL